MADERIEDITGGELTTPAPADLFVVLDASDTTDDPDGTVKRIKHENLQANHVLRFAPASLQPVETNSPTFEVVTITNVILSVAACDDTTQEYLNGKFIVPNGLNTTGTVTFRAIGHSKTAAASKNVAFDFDHAAVANDEDIDSATYTTEASGDKATINNQNDVEIHEWTETVANLGWVAEDVVYFRISRDPAATNDLTGDWYLHEFSIEVPV